jgi:hypothetical protein
VTGSVTGSLARSFGDSPEPTDGYDVITTDGDRVGTVVGVSAESILVERRRLFRSWRALPMRLAVVRASDRTVIMLVSPDELWRSPKVERDEPVDDELVASHYQATDLVRSALEASLDTNKRD